MGEAHRDAVIEAFEERAAIIEYCAGLPRCDAERRAYWEVRRRFGIEAGKAIANRVTTKRAND